MGNRVKEELTSGAEGCEVWGGQVLKGREGKGNRKFLANRIQGSRKFETHASQNTVAKETSKSWDPEVSYQNVGR